MSVRPRILVSIVNYNSVDLLAGCLASITSAHVDEVHVLDNGSGPEEVRRLEDLAASYPEVRFHFSEQNLGFAAGQNRLIRTMSAAADDVVWILNPDTTVPEGVPQRLVELLVRGEADVVSPVVMTLRDGNERLWFSGGSIDRRRGRVVESQLGRDPKALVGAPTFLTTQFISGAALMIGRGTWEHLGGFREDLFMYWEDVDLSLRMDRLGLRRAVVPQAVIFHAEGASSRGSRSGRARAYYYSGRNRILVCRSDGVRGFGYLFGAGALMTLRLVAYSMLRESSGRLVNALAVLRGSWDALRTPLEATPHTTGIHRGRGGTVGR